MDNLIIKSYFGGQLNNSGGSVKGAALFEALDVAALTLVNENITQFYPDWGVVTNHAEIKYHARVLPYSFVEVYGQIDTVSGASVNMTVELHSRQAKDREWQLATTGKFGFSIINEQKQIVRIPRDIRDAFKR